MSTQPSVTPPLPPRARRKARRTRKKGKFLRKLTISFLLLLIGLGAGFVVYTYWNLQGALDQVTAGMDQEVPKHELAKEKPLSILLLGLDNRPKTGSLNTDVIMVATLNPELKSATVVSIPRDTYINVDGWRATKANHYYSLAYKRDDLATTYSEVKDVFGKFLDIPIDYVTVVNFKTLEEIVDQLGGIEVEVDQNMRYVDPTDGTDINLQAGLQTLNGKEALDFVRYRFSNRGTPESSDFDRNRRQQLVVSEIINKLQSFNAVTKINGIIKALGNHIHTDIPQAQIKSLATTYAGISNDRIQYIALEGTWKSPYVYLNEQGFKEAKDALKAQMRED